MAKPKLPKDFLARLKAVKAKRPKTVIQHILKHGYITTEELKRLYGYDHPPRAARDVREQGIPLETFRVKSAEGRTIAAYRFADPSKIERDQIGGRKAFSKEFKAVLVGKSDSRCQICLEPYEERYLQIDHRVPYAVAGDIVVGARKPDDYMLLCGSCNRAKSWSCEHCVNWLETKKPELCQTCYWASPESYRHIALRPIRRLDLVWLEQEVTAYERLRERAQKMRKTMPGYVKSVLRRHIENSDEE